MAAPIKIALTGRMRSGKDSVADYLARQYGFARFAFGDGIRKVCRELFPDQFRNPDGSERKPRALLQGVGQAMRTFDPDVWVNATMRNIERMREGDVRIARTYFTKYPRPIVITDLRQPNEYKRLRAEGFVIIRVNASDETRIQRMIDAGDTYDERDLTHETELHTDGFAVDYEIENNGTLAELRAKVDAVVAEIMTKEAAE